jgi:hypothetical protein
VLVALERDNKRGYLPAEHGLYPMVLLEQLGRPHCHEDSILTPVPANLVTTALKALR